MSVLSLQRTRQGQEQRQTEKMAVEKVLAPIGAVSRVYVLDVDAHVSGQDLCDEQNRQAGDES